MPILIRSCLCQEHGSLPGFVLNPGVLGEMWNSCSKEFTVQVGGTGEGFEVQKYGDGRVALIGFPSVGKSTLLSQLTGTESEVAAYEFTTLTCIPGIIHYKGTKIQLLDLPGIIEGAAQGKGRGRQVCTQPPLANARNAVYSKPL